MPCIALFMWSYEWILAYKKWHEYWHKAAPTQFLVYMKRGMMFLSLSSPHPISLAVYNPTFLLGHIDPIRGWVHWRGKQRYKGPLKMSIKKWYNFSYTFFRNLYLCIFAGFYTEFYLKIHLFLNHTRRNHTSLDRWNHTRRTICSFSVLTVLNFVQRLIPTWIKR
jgi:hypothetical protein